MTKIDYLAASQGLIPQHLRGVDITIVIAIAIATTIAIMSGIVGITAVVAVAVAAVAAVAAVTTNPD